MAIAYDNASGSYFGTPATSFTLSHTTSGSDRLLIVGILTNVSPGDVVTGVTYNSVSMSRINVLATLQSGQNVYIYVYALANPSSGTNNIVVSSSGSTDAGVVAQSYTGALQSTPTISATQAAGTDLTQTVTTTVNNSWLYGLVRSETASLTASTGTIRRLTGFSIDSGDSNGPIVIAGSASLVWTGSGANDGIVVAFAPSAAATNSGFFNFI